MSQSNGFHQLSHFSSLFFLLIKISSHYPFRLCGVTTISTAHEIGDGSRMVSSYNIDVRCRGSIGSVMLTNLQILKLGYTQSMLTGLAQNVL